ncbi:CDP-glycerol glycerophosphotransferase family protein [Enterococcus sp. DIV0660C]|uniref:CDP-glycerol glycerophosphotransferase family protein n=1 Tax=Enterococcus sp. DIV0660C TaxID=2230880 RepID=UPI001A8EEC4C|nr:CDP-glycerol glycerophosphotransferase family protein [Enterococcus sp. DIV0660C]MBO0431825.1 CDP-glycerol glycerophosphotransferase family protein [Enterococcus sp. DIV0660C]
MDIVKNGYMTAAMLWPKRKLTATIVYIMSFSFNEGDLIKQLHLNYPGKVTVFFVDKCREYAEKLKSEGVDVRPFTPKSLFLGRNLSLLKQAKVIIVDNYFPELAVMASDQIVIQVWHADGAIKKFGWDDPQTKQRSRQDQKRFQKVYNSFNYVVVNSDKMAGIFQKSYDLNLNVIKKVGSLRLETVHKVAKTVKQTKKFILYAPTYRPEQKDMEHIFTQALATFSKLSGEQFYVHLHPTINQENWTLPENVHWWNQNIMESYPNVKLLITDYSASTFEYLTIQEQPKIIFFCPDFDKYKNNPGIQDDFLEWAPGPVVKSQELLGQTIQSYSYEANEQLVKKTKLLWNQYENGETVGEIMALVKKELGEIGGKNK